MAEFAAVDTIPISKDANGVIRVSGTRVTLETLVESFRQGGTPEEIAQQYPTVPIGDIYEIIGYYLRHSAEFEAYFAERASAANLAKAENDRRSPTSGIRDRLLARRFP